jgi:hypothetical protein
MFALEKNLTMRLMSSRPVSRTNFPRLYSAVDQGIHLDNLGLHGKDRKRVKNWHKNIVKSEIAKQFSEDCVS